MDFFRRYGNLLKADGTNQSQRLLPGLEPGYIKPDERSLSDLVEYAHRLAAEIRFYELTGQAMGDWRPFLEQLIDPATGRARPTPELEAALAARRDWPPHLVLFLVFLKLFGHLQEDLNELPERHLRHYYENELGLRRRGAVGDAVHVIFDLARNAVPTPLAAGTLLDAGKDDQGRPLSYATQSELVVSAAAVTGILRLVMDRDRSDNRRFFIADAIAEAEGPSWYTFGRRQLDLDPSQRFMTEAPLGFALAAPLLRLGEGQRTVTILARLAPDPALSSPLGLGYALDAAFTGAKGWLVPDRVVADLSQNAETGHPELKIVLSLGPAAAAVVPFDPALHGPGPVSDWPVLRCLIKGHTGIYELLDGFVAERVELRVTAEGVRDLLVQNAEGPLNASKPMPLFGSRPEIGAPFYIGSAEVFSKTLTSLFIKLDWKAPPEDLNAHYRVYFDATPDSLTDNFQNSFRVRLDFLYGGRFDKLVISEQSLFAPVITDQASLEAEGPLVFGTAFNGQPYVPQPSLKTLEPYGAASQYGFVRLTLTSPTQDGTSPYATTVPFEAFGHAAYVRRYAIQAIALSQATTDPKPELPNQPYTPVLAGLSLTYTATAAFVPGDIHADEAFYVYGPFGTTRAGGGVAARLVPEIEGADSEFLGMLLLGVEKFQPPANLSLLFATDAGTATASPALQRGATEWSCLSGGSWQRLPPSAVLNDSTQGFQKQGLVALALPREASTQHEALPSGRVWLRALIRSVPESAARMVKPGKSQAAIETQAVLATFQPESAPLKDYGTHLQTGLGAGTLTGLQWRNAAIKRVRQPYPSFGGRSEEASADFFRRCSERLRHRNRAVTGWDLERLVLEAFPEVFKVKCLPHTDGAATLKAGHTALVIVPNLRRGGATNLLEPRAGAVLMADIETYLAAGISTPFATLHAIHPVYERIRVVARIAFRSGLDAGYYASVLNEDLRRFLSPWAYQEGEDILFGARIYRSELLAFMEGRDYVDHVTDFKLYQSYEGQRAEGIRHMTIGLDFVVRPAPRPAIAEMQIGNDLIVGRGVEVAETTQAHAILVSHPEHLITPIDAGESPCAGVTRLGIGYLTVALDFRVAPEEA